MASVLSCNQSPGRRRSPPLLLLVIAAVSAVPSLWAPGLAARSAALVQTSGNSEQVASGAVARLLSSVEESLRPLREQVVAGNIVPKFGERAEEVVRAAVQQAGNAGPEIERTVDAMLQSLFLRQLALLRQQISAKSAKGSSRQTETVSQADQQFVTQAEELRRPGSSWSYDEERYALRAILEGGFRREAVLAAEKRLAAQSQQSTVEIIAKLQGQMENLQQRVQLLRSGSPWFLSSSYRIPGTPIQLIGRYQQGRGSVEINLSPDRDPVTAEAGFVQGVGPANLGVTGNLGL